jgi:RimJ/RimL family protein N-acetyltransferase
MVINTQFETERLYLKATSKEDAPFILALLNMPKWKKFIGDRNVHTIEEASTYIEERMTPQLKRLGFSNYTVIRKSDNTKMGTCGLYDREGLAGLDIGFAFLPEHEGKGYAFESSEKMKEVARDLFGVKELKAITSQENLSSQRLLKKLGFHLDGTTTLKDDKEELFLFRLQLKN